MKKVTVVILNYKVKEEVLKCVKSVEKSSYKNLEVIVVDNASGDDLEQEIKNFPEVIFIASQKNLGYTGGNNLGIKYGLNHGADFVFILNPDTQITPECIEKLVDEAEKPQVGILGPKIFFADKKTLWYAGGIYDKQVILGRHRGVDEKDQGKYDKVEETDFVTGGAMFVSSEVFKTIGFFDEKYFLYLEDLDFCFRAKKVGFKIIYVPKAQVYHANAKSTGLGSPLQDYYLTRNRMLLAAKFLPIRTQAALFKEALRNIKSRVRRRAWLDFWLGNLGKGNTDF